MARHKALLLALTLGALLGGILHPYQTPFLNGISQHLLGPIGQIFLRLIFMVIVPLVVSSLILGVYELGKGHGLGRVARKTVIYTIIASSLSVLIGITLVNVFRPGKYFQISPSNGQYSVLGIKADAASAKSFSEILVDLFPKNPVESATRALSDGLIPLMVFALIFGIALSLVDKNRNNKGVLTQFLEQIFEVSMKIIDFAMIMAPAGVFAIVFNTIYRSGFAFLGSLVFYSAVVILGLLIQQFAVYPLLLKKFTRRSPWKFFKLCRDVYLYAFSTASSNATLPLSLKTAEEKLGLPPRISRFVLTVGSTANQNGTALFEGVTVLFLAQVYSIELSLTQQVQVALMSIVAGIGTAGVPGGSLPLIMILLQSVGIPAEGIGLILGADRLLDMCRTTLNVSGDLVIAALVSEGEKA
jgi:DAACS family dicarboxylate/amino acid:cation (Na+ or H+) symporter